MWSGAEWKSLATPRQSEQTPWRALGRRGALWTVLWGQSVGQSPGASFLRAPAGLER